MLGLDLFSASLNPLLGFSGVSLRTAIDFTVAYPPVLGSNAAR